MPNNPSKNPPLGMKHSPSSNTLYVPLLRPVVEDVEFQGGEEDVLDEDEDNLGTCQDDVGNESYFRWLAAEFLLLLLGVILTNGTLRLCYPQVFLGVKLMPPTFLMVMYWISGRTFHFATSQTSIISWVPEICSIAIILLAVRHRIEPAISLIVASSVFMAGYSAFRLHRWQAEVENES